ncbi:winged helix-turn-helix transcriptional regulator [Deinococcus hopiensis]|uniref:Transcriptional regulator, HxlR family n=1 Tax=Deinococcus hopiensis KR-140 TaxID=695939 RepID=A0A1W1VFE2_9DEIO|nr:helix-turn-helix domain-containing protein [Deinococcus hopiensis]SMB92072.1 transcriptional regulator, HxlR family [Deinococcus hopiensis KR-140]
MVDVEGARLVRGTLFPGLYTPPAETGPGLDRLPREITGRVADKWTVTALEVPADHGRLRFTQVGEWMGGLSQKTLTKALRQMGTGGPVPRTVYPVIPPQVKCGLTDMGGGLSAAFCGGRHWAERHREAVGAARQTFGSRCGNS